MTLPHGCKSLPDQPLIWDASRLAVAMTCWRKHYYQTIRGLRLDYPTSVHLDWGKAYHQVAELVDKLRLAGEEPGTIERRAVKLAEELSRDEKGQSRWSEVFTLYRCSSSEQRPSKRDPSKMTTNTERCSEAKKWTETPGTHCHLCGLPREKREKRFNSHPKKTAANLGAAALAYCLTEGLDPYKFPNGESATEVQYSVDLPINSSDAVPYKLLANIDSVVDHNSWAAMRERKTTGLPKLDGRFWTTYLMNPQSDTYDLVGSVVLEDEGRAPKLLIEATRITTSGDVEIVREVIPMNEERREEWFEELQGVIQNAQSRAESVQSGAETVEQAFPRNTTACHGKFGTCPFWRLCTAGRSQREELIAADYRVEHWDPVAATTVEESE